MIKNLIFSLCKIIAYPFNRQIKKQNEELLFERIWRDTKVDMDWLKEPLAISPGRMAVGYNYIYVVTRILNEFRPRRTLDIGLGISTKLISRYYEYNSSDINNALHLVLEHDNDWINFCMNNYKLSNVTQIAKQNLTYKKFKGYNCCSYENIGKDIIGKKFSFISLDAPFLSKRYSRNDIISYIPEILEDSFVFIMDDYERLGGQDTIREIEYKLKQNGINYHKGVYGGFKDCVVLASDDNKYMCTL